MNDAVEQIVDTEQRLAIIVSRRFNEPGIHFFTPNDLSQQLAYMHYPRGKLIPAHVHNPVHRQIIYTQETLFVRRGKLRVDFYNSQREYVRSNVLEAGDVLLLIAGGHGFEVLEEIEMIEVKQGPYLGEQDKTRFEGVDSSKINVKPPNKPL
ncbi:MAG TPA: hypothetical protein VGL59_13655 [Polyangia bacterium]